jgi:periplasmic divalent cation tolerance protein
MREDSCAVVTTACANWEEAEKIASALLARALVACVQMLPIHSRYVWKGELCADEEVLLLIKCRRDRYADIEQTILDNHGYELPEILLLPVEGGYQKYIAWIKKEGMTDRINRF